MAKVLEYKAADGTWRRLTSTATGINSDSIEINTTTKTVGLADLKVGDYVASIDFSRVPFEGASTSFDSDYETGGSRTEILFEDGSGIRSVSTEDWGTYAYVKDYFNSDYPQYDNNVIAAPCDYLESAWSSTYAVVGKKVKAIYNAATGDNPLIDKILNKGFGYEIYSNDFSIVVATETATIKATNIYNAENNKLATESYVEDKTSCLTAVQLITWGEDD